MLWDVTVNLGLCGGAAVGVLGRNVYRGEDCERLTLCGDSGHPVVLVWGSEPRQLLDQSLLQAGYSDRDLGLSFCPVNPHKAGHSVQFCH